jgi:hypothetical protein
VDTEYRFFSKNVLSVIVLSLIVVVSLAGCVTEEEAMREAASTDLSTEHIDGIKPGMIMTDADFIREYGHFEPDPANDYYAPRRDYDQYWNEDSMIGVSVDRSTMEVLSIVFLEDNNHSSTSKGITLGTPIDEVIAAYGEDYYTYTDREQTIYVIGYVDHENNFSIGFVHLNDKIVSVSFRYAFDRLNWID